MNIIAYIIIFFFSVTPVKGICDIYYGVLHGSQTLKYKSPFAGMVTIGNFVEGDVFNEKNKLFSILNHEYSAKKDILNTKRKAEEKKLIKLNELKKNSLIMFSKGFISKEILNEIDEKINNTELSLMGLDLELKSLEHLLKLSSPFLPPPFIIRDIFVTNEQYVNAGDDIMSVELLNKFYIDIKIDPVNTGNIKDKNIKYRSLVSSLSGSATVVKIVRANGGSLEQTENTSGLRVVTLLINGDQDKLSNLMDTAFEIIIDD
ncbi:hypothetical protein [Escherichia coli]|uniref:hypothetical protein n=1 Tax=Escherichia coli TaxID=562 RepID=UPI00244E1A1B|nr:hypothetical protein [Escherichia coli]